MAELTQLDQIQEDVALIKKILTGNGNPENGIIVRLDRLEVWRKTITYGFIVLSLPFIGALAALLWAIFLNEKNVIGK